MLESHLLAFLPNQSLLGIGSCMLMIFGAAGGVLSCSTSLLYDAVPQSTWGFVKWRYGMCCGRAWRQWKCHDEV